VSLQGPLQPLRRLKITVASTEVPTQVARQRERAVTEFRLRQRKIECRVQVRPFTFDAVKPDTLAFAEAFRINTLGEFDEVRQVRLARAGLAAARSEALLCKQSHAVEQAITGRVGRAIHAQQRLVDQAAEPLQRLRVVESECGADRS